MIINQVTIMQQLTIKRVIVNPPATVVVFSDNTIQIEMCSKDDIFDADIGVALAIAHKLAGSKRKFKAIVKNLQQKKKVPK